MVLHQKFFAIVFLVLVLIQSGVFAVDDIINPTDATNFIGQTKTVCGSVASTHYAPESNGQPTFINLDMPYPYQIFTALIWGENRVKFPGSPEKFYQRKEVCVSGEIQVYKGIPEIVVVEPGQIWVR